MSATDEAVRAAAHQLWLCGRLICEYHGVPDIDSECAYCASEWAATAAAVAAAAPILTAAAEERARTAEAEVERLRAALDGLHEHYAANINASTTTGFEVANRINDATIRALDVAETPTTEAGT